MIFWGLARAKESRLGRRDISRGYERRGAKKKNCGGKAVKEACCLRGSHGGRVIVTAGTHTPLSASPSPVVVVEATGQPRH